ncbi:pyocin knob domain-containing protein [Neorhizobium sp. IRS_2294]|uniref:pyocin knob domain-containing protein n=1 Tax=unclassified Neorhizobium TaxID=2629175 RepID=UPI003D2E5655
MALQTTYSTGTATINAGETVVTGVGTGWLNFDLRPGDLFWAAGLSVRIASVDSNTQLTLAYPWPGASRNAQNYEARVTPDVTRVLASARAVLDALTNGVLYAFSGLVGAADRLPYFTGAGTAALATFTSFGRSVVGAANQAAGRTALGLANVAASGSAADLLLGLLPDGRLRPGLQEIAPLVPNLNVLNQTGVYKASASATGSPGVSGTCLHLQYDASYSIQVFYNAANGASFIRVNIAGAPGAWDPVYNTAAQLNVAYAQVAGPVTDKAQSIGSSSRRYSSLWAAKANIGGDTESSRVSVVINGAGERALDFTTASLLRWSWRVSGGETGADAGSVITLEPYTDAGASKTAALTIVRTTGVVTFSAPPKLPPFTVATLPAASAYSRCIVYVSDGSGGKRQATSNGTNWVWGDGTVVS